MYRRFLAKGIKLYVNNRLVEPFDPTYSMVAARHARIPEIKVRESRLVFSSVIQVKRRENNPKTRKSEDRGRNGKALRAADRGLGIAAIESP